MTDLAVSPGGRPISYAPLGPKALWRTKGLKLPDYIRGVARGINPADPESAIDEAVAAIKRWALTSKNPSVRAAAAKALAEWEAAKAAAHALSTTNQRSIDLAETHIYHWKHGWIPLDGDMNSPKHLGGGLTMIPGHHGGAAHITHWNVKVDGDHVGQVQIMSAKRVMARRRQPASGDMRRIAHFESPESAARWIARSHKPHDMSTTQQEAIDLAMTKGALPPLPGSSKPRFQINDHTDLKKAVKAVGRAKTGHAAIRRHIIARAKAIGGTHLLPANWTSTGNMK